MLVCRTGFDLYTLHFHPILKGLAKLPFSVVTPHYSNLVASSFSIWVLMSSIASSTSSVPLDLRSLIHVAQVASHITSRKYRYPLIEVGRIPDVSAWSLRILWVCLVSVFLLNDSFIFPAKQHSHALRPAVLTIGLSFIPFDAFASLWISVKLVWPRR